MAIRVTKAESRLKPIKLWFDAEMKFITLADRAASWTPWAKKADDTLGISRLTEALRKLREAIAEKKKSDQYAEKFNENHDEKGRFAPSEGGLDYKGKAEAALKSAQNEVGTEFDRIGGAIADKLGLERNKEASGGWEGDTDPDYASYHTLYESKDGSILNETLEMRLNAEGKVEIDYNAEHETYGGVGQSVSKEYKADKLDKAVADMEKARDKMLKDVKTDLVDELQGTPKTGEDNNPQGRKDHNEFRDEIRQIQKEIYKGKAQKSDIGDTPMAGEVIQAILMPVGQDIEELKKFIPAEQFALLGGAVAEKHDGCNKYIVADAEKFEKLEIVPLGETGIKVFFGPLKDAAKADSTGLISMPPGHTKPSWAMNEDKAIVVRNESFDRILYTKTDALRAAIIGFVEIKDNFDEIESLTTEAINGFRDWLVKCLEELRVTQEAALKADTNKPGIGRRLMNLVTRRTAQDIANKGDNTMTPDMKELTESLVEALTPVVSEVAEKSAEKTVEKMISEAKSDEARKADEQAAAELEKQRNDLIAKTEANEKKLDTVLEFIEAQKADTEARKTADVDKEKELAGLKETQARLDAEMKANAEKMDALERTPGASTFAEDKGKTTDTETVVTRGKAEKHDDLYNRFGGMFGENRRAARA